MPTPADPTRARQAAAGIVRRLREHGHAAYFAGGCVRDELLGLRPTDFDVATDATPDRVRALFERTAEVGASFGVMLVRAGPVTVEVATFRSEGPYSDRRRPDAVRFSDARTDAQRRDFTVNALFLDPLAPPDSPERVVDFVGGLADLRARVLRAVGDPAARLAEDHLRALRAVRIAGRLSLEIEPGTAAAIREHAAELAGVSRERIGEEVRKIMRDPGRARAVGLLQALGLDAPALGEPHLDNRSRTLAALGADAGMPACLAAWALDRHPGLAADSARQVVARWRRALMLSNEEEEGLRAVLGGVCRVRTCWGTMSVAHRKRMAASEWFGAVMEVLAAVDRVLFDRLTGDIEELRRSTGGLAPPPLVTGDDLIGIGLAPGPRFKVVLDALYDAQLEGRLGDRARALDWARHLWGGPHGPGEDPPAPPGVGSARSRPRSGRNPGNTGRGRGV